MWPDDHFTFDQVQNELIAEEARLEHCLRDQEQFALHSATPLRTSTRNRSKCAGIEIDFLNGKWHFCENPEIQYPFYKVPSKNENSKSISDSEERSAEISSSVKVP
ncbi:hypothetical protein AVEN_271049-1 [Araneus ventricosus]|uniref:Uncharacterized protein n=1 Tax=Araneus ventricosus TaxID=182803 RepID=A0A4Y2FF59_ARAVE|nr:hypothetical protein AVEN_271049-1 [Araneus ventricosus]